MYGLVNQAIKDLVVHEFGVEKWDQICQRSKIGNTDFVSMNYYDDSLTYSLVGSASSVLGLSSDDILKSFGRYWVLYTANEGYGPMMDLFGKSFKECLMNLNNLHARMGMTMPQMSPPRFDFTAISENEYRVQYVSKRSGLCPMVEGLLGGLALKYDMNVQISFEPEMEKKIFKILILK